MKINRDLIKQILREKLEEKQTSELDEVGRPQLYTDDLILKTACNFKNIRDFKNNHSELYNAAYRRQMMLKIRTKCNYKPLGNLYSRMLYMYVWEKNTNAVYFGLTCDEDRRYAEHTKEEREFLEILEVSPSCKIGSSSGVKNFIKIHGNFDRYVPITDGYIDAELAGLLEMCLIDHYRNDTEWKSKITVVNRTKGGELGGRCLSNARKVIKDSEKILKNDIKTPEEFEKILPTAYKFWSKDSQKKKIMNQSLKFRLFDDAPYSKDEILNITKNYNNYYEFKQENDKVFKSARRNKMLELIFPQDKVFLNINNNKKFDNLKDLSEDLNVDYIDLYNVLKRGQGEEKYNVKMIDLGEFDFENISETKLHIKKILTEEVNERLIFKGINILVNSLKQEYPFILDWKLVDSLDEYRSTIYINLIVRYEDAKEFYGLEPQYEKFLYLGKTLATPISPFRRRYDEQGVEEASKMNQYIEDMYEYVPNEMKMITSFDEPNKYYNDYYKVVKIDNYIFVDERTN